MRVAGIDSNRDTKRTKVFLGLNTVLDPMRGTPGSQGVAPKSWEWMQRADNIDLTDSGGIARREGFTLFTPGVNITASFSTFDFSRAFVIDSGTLKQVNADGTTIDLATGLTGVAHWAEINDVVYLSCDQKLEIHKNRVQTWGVPVPTGGDLVQASGGLAPGLYQICFTHLSADGKEGGASPFLAIQVVDGGITIESPPIKPGHQTLIYIALRGTVFNFAAALTDAHVGPYTYGGGPTGRELTNQFLDAPPAGITHVAAYAGQLYGAEYLPESDSTVIWGSEPLGFHLFNLNDGFFLVPGKVAQMAASSDTLMLSTESRTFLYNQNGLEEVAEYGSIDGQHADIGPDNKLYFWTKRGLCRALPFENLTQSNVSVAPGVRAAGGVIQRHGYTKYVVALQSGGSPFNKR